MDLHHFVHYHLSSVTLADSWQIFEKLYHHHENRKEIPMSSSSPSLTASLSAWSQHRDRWRGPQRFARTCLAGASSLRPLTERNELCFRRALLDLSLSNSHAQSVLLHA